MASMAMQFSSHFYGRSLSDVFAGSSLFSSGDYIHSLRLCLESVCLLFLVLLSLNRGLRSLPPPSRAIILPVSVHPPLPLYTTAFHVPPDPFPPSWWWCPSCNEKAGLEDVNPFGLLPTTSWPADVLPLPPILLFMRKTSAFSVQDQSLFMILPLCRFRD